MEIEVYKKHIKEGLVILRGTGYFGRVDRNNFFNYLRSLSEQNPLAIAYDFQKVHSMTSGGIDCILDAHSALASRSIEDYLILPTSNPVQDAVVASRAHETIYFGELDKILKRIRAPLPKEQLRIAESCRRRLGLKV